MQYQARKHKKKKRKEEEEEESTCMNVFLNIELLPCSNVERYRDFFRPLSATILMLYFILIRYAGIKIERNINHFTDR